MNTAKEQSENTIREILRSQWNKEPAVRIDSPPGAGKTDIVEKLAVQSLALLKERVMVATNTNEQAFDIARRLSAHYPRQSFWLFLKDGLRAPVGLMGASNLNIVHKGADLPIGPCVVIATAAKWTWLSTALPPFDLLIIDEAFQLPDFRFHPIAGMASRIVLIGDPGQIEPFVTSPVERWLGQATGPHIACPEVLLARHPDIQRFSLPVSRRLVADTVRFIQPAFYPEMPFSSLSQPGERGISFSLPGNTQEDKVLDRLALGESLVMSELPEKHTGEHDEELSQTIAKLLERLVTRETHIKDGEREAPLRPEQIGVVCAHVPQVNAVQERLSQRSSGVLVETANRFQGLEREVVIVQHPLSGRADVDRFHADTGRFCVMLSRHRLGCVVVGRAGIEEKLASTPMTGERILSQPQDKEFEGRQSHKLLLKTLREKSRISYLKYGF
jgi:hypothetical protein